MIDVAGFDLFTASDYREVMYYLDEVHLHLPELRAASMEGPTCDPKKVKRELKKILATNPPVPIRNMVNCALAELSGKLR
jgi:hypothetical protein